MGLLDFDKRDTLLNYPVIEGKDIDVLSSGEPYVTLQNQVGTLKQNSIVNFWTFGRYAMHHVLRYVLSQTGPADVKACTWALSTRAVDDLLTLRNKGLLRSFKLWIDPRVKARSPEPLQMLQLNWPVTISPVHATLATVCNEKWKVSIFGSLNFTTNHQPERGQISTVDGVFDTDNKILQEAFYARTDE